MGVFLGPKQKFSTKLPVLGFFPTVCQAESLVTLQRFTLDGVCISHPTGGQFDLFKVAKFSVAQIPLDPGQISRWLQWTFPSDGQNRRGGVLQSWLGAPGCSVSFWCHWWWQKHHEPAWANTLLAIGYWFDLPPSQTIASCMGGRSKLLFSRVRIQSIDSCRAPPKKHGKVATLT